MAMAMAMARQGMVNFLIHCLNFSMCAGHVCAMRTFWDDDAKASVARQARQVRQPGKYEDPRSLPTHLYDLLDALDLADELHLCDPLLALEPPD